jgi:hypothetical protein
MTAALRRIKRLAGLTVLVTLAGCAPPRTATPDDVHLVDDEETLLTPAQLASPAFSVTQRIRGKQGLEDVAFECFVQLSAGKLTLSGATLHSTHAFSVEQDQRNVRAQRAAQRDVPLEPTSYLQDIHRIFFRGLTGVTSDGIHERADGDELVRERWQDGRLVERSFHSLDTFARLILISFEGAPAPLVAPRVQLTNLYFGYSLQIDNMRQERLGDGYALDVEKRAPTGP